MAGNHYGRAVFSTMYHRFSDQRDKGAQLIRIGSADKINTAAFYQFFNINHHQGLAANPPSAAGVGWFPVMAVVRLSKITRTK